MIEYRQYEKGCDEDGPDQQTFRELPVGERRQDASAGPITSEPESRSTARGFPVCPR